MTTITTSQSRNPRPPRRLSTGHSEARSNKHPDPNFLDLQRSMQLRSTAAIGSSTVIASINALDRLARTLILHPQR
jgi:hypothetical protein